MKKEGRKDVKSRCLMGRKVRKMDDRREGRRRKKALLKSVMQDGMGVTRQKEERMAREFMHGSSLDVAPTGGSWPDTPELSGPTLAWLGVRKRCGGEQQVKRVEVGRGGGDRDRGDEPGRQGFDFDGGKDTDRHGWMG